MADSWLVPPPVVPVVLALLYAATPTISGSDEIPDPRPSKFYRVTRIGGDYVNPAFAEARVLVECWAETSSDAEDMAMTAMTACKNAGGKTFGDVFVHGAENIQGPVDYNDPAIQDRRRCQFTVTLLTSTGS